MLSFKPGAPARWRRREAAVEVVLVFALILLDIWWLRFRFFLAWIPILVLILNSHLARGETPEGLGFRRDNLQAAWNRIAGFVLFAAGAWFAGGLLLGTLRDIRANSAVLSLALYGLWGLFQQYLLNGFFVNRLSEASHHQSPHRIALWAAALFAAAHLPNWFLMLITFAGGYLSARVYQRDRNLYVLGLAHGILGFLTYLAVPDSLSHHLYVGPRWFSGPGGAPPL